MSGLYTSIYFLLSLKVTNWHNILINYHPRSPWDQNFPISKTLTIQGMRFGYKITSLGAVIWK